MDLEKMNFIGRYHCPECNCMYILINNEIIFCPGCEYSSKKRKYTICEDRTRKEELVQFQI
jgi:hypothetical protein